jgi:hypothetical protein
MLSILFTVSIEGVNKCILHIDSLECSLYKNYYNYNLLLNLGTVLLGRERAGRNPVTLKTNIVITDHLECHENTPKLSLHRRPPRKLTVHLAL